VKRAILIVVLLVASQPLLVGVGVMAKWIIECSGGACAGTVRANAPFDSPRDLLLTALALTAPYLLAMLFAVAWLLIGRAAHRVGQRFPASANSQSAAESPAGVARERPARQRPVVATPLMEAIADGRATSP
jgi:hypothetical protein